jgi:DNA-directed RNA polymerase specialized sigma24 family protein
VIVYINKLLSDWARWRLTGAECLFARPSVYWLGQRVADSETPAEACIPINDLECSATDIAVSALEPVLREAVEAMYCRTGSNEMAARALGCSERTLWRRVDRAHILIMGYLNDQAAGIPVMAWATRVRRPQAVACAS